mmetsp:Transcript_40654/g.81532  ORF Transcript_40654/g.81532 Transcript_40654/m.81532 type:complete len:272 (+) Transcript_40654:967-1782(+)
MVGRLALATPLCENHVDSEHGGVETGWFGKRLGPVGGGSGSSRVGLRVVRKPGGEDRHRLLSRGGRCTEGLARILLHLARILCLVRFVPLVRLVRVLHLLQVLHPIRAFLLGLVTVTHRAVIVDAANLDADTLDAVTLDAVTLGAATFGRLVERFSRPEHGVEHANTQPLVGDRVAVAHPTLDGALAHRLSTSLQPLKRKQRICAVPAAQGRGCACHVVYGVIPLELRFDNRVQRSTELAQRLGCEHVWAGGDVTERRYGCRDSAGAQLDA